MSRWERSQLVEEIVSRVELVEIVSETVTLTQKGKDFWGLCPFHVEDTPSFSVSPDKQVFYCFGCQVGGNALTFLRKKDNLTYGEALAILAEKAGVSLGPGIDSPTQRQYRSEKQRVYRLNELATVFYQEMLEHSTEGAVTRSYLLDRGITPESMKRFRLGYAPEKWDAILNHLTRQGFNPSELERCGLVVARSSGSGYYDRFRHRLMFPIADQTGQVVGFGGRILGEGNPKYLNSPENRFFDKGQLFYGLHLARQAIQTHQYSVLVEGYMDVLMCHQNGIHQVVASMGTALTQAQVRLILRYAPEVVLAYDQDEAGQTATLRAIGLIRKQGGRARVIAQFDDKDPDEIIRKNGADYFRTGINEAQDFFSFKLQRILAQRSLRTAADKAGIFAEFWEDIRQAGSELERQEYFERLSMALQVPETFIREEYRKSQRTLRKNRDQLDKNTNNVHTKNGKLSGTPAAVIRAERYLLRFMLEDLRLFKRIEQEHGLDLFTDDQLRQIAINYQKVIQIIPEAEEKAAAVHLASLIEELEDDSIRSILLSICMENSTFPIDTDSHKEKAINDYIHTILEYKYRKRMVDIQLELGQAEHQGDQLRSRNLITELATIQEKIRFLEAKGSSTSYFGKGGKRL
ncbi:MAG: DNA primase [Syntrophomonadaceae bacterium]|nr:DNA primase [Syntrophomonadaceae bacterium]